MHRKASTRKASTVRLESDKNYQNVEIKLLCWRQWLGSDFLERKTKAGAQRIVRSLGMPAQ